MSNVNDESSILAADAQTLHKMGYAQELSRRMSGFSNFAISFSIICILAGGVTSFQSGFCTGGGFGVFGGWILGGFFAMIVACSMAQIASAYPTAGGLYHWSSLLGGRGWGWATAFVNLLGMILATASVDVGVYLLFNNLVLGNIFGITTASWGLLQQTAAVVVIMLTQAALNHRGIRIVTALTDFSGYMILVVVVALIGLMFYSIEHLDLARLISFTNYSGTAGGSVVPPSHNKLYVFLLGLLLPFYTLNGFDGSAHTSEETVDAKRNVPKGMINAVVLSFIFGLVMVSSFVLAIPDADKAAVNGGNIFFVLFQNLDVPAPIKDIFYVAIVVLNYICALALVTSTSRMIFAFSRDGGLPGHRLWKRVSPIHRTPVAAIWLTAVLSVAATLYSPAFTALAAGTAMFLYICYTMPVIAGFFAEGKTWTEFGPFRLGMWSKPFAILSVIGTGILIYVGLQPPNQILITYSIALVVILAVLWFAVARRRFAGPPIGDMVKARLAEIQAEEKAVGETVGTGLNGEILDAAV